MPDNAPRPNLPSPYQATTPSHMKHPMWIVSGGPGPHHLARTSWAPFSIQSVDGCLSRAYCHPQTCPIYHWLQLPSHQPKPPSPQLPARSPQQLPHLPALPHPRLSLHSGSSLLPLTRQLLLLCSSLHPLCLPPHLPSQPTVRPPSPTASRTKTCLQQAPPQPAPSHRSLPHLQHSRTSSTS